MREHLKLGLLVILCVLLSLGSLQLSETMNHNPASEEIDVGNPQFSLSDTVVDYVDEAVSNPYGTDTNVPPNGMGELVGVTMLEEETYPVQQWTNTEH